MSLLIVMMGAAVIVCGIILRIVGSATVHKGKPGALLTVSKLEKDKGRELERLRALHAQHPDIIPAVPQGVGALEFQGWFAETNRRLETWAIRHRSSADMALRIQLQRQINDLEEEHLRYGKTQSEILLLEHRHAAEIAKLEREIAEAQDQTAQIKERAEQRKNSPPKLEATARLSKIDRVAQVKEHAARNLEKYSNDPEIQDLIKRKCDDDIMRIMEGPD